MPLISERELAHIKQILDREMKYDVKLINFTQEFECMYCRETRELVETLGRLSDKIKVEVYDFVKDANKAKEFGVDKIPATIIMGEKDYGIRYYGVPAGYEFVSFLEDIIDVSRRTTRLSKASKDRLKAINKPVHIQVFVTPTCPYCPRMVRLAHQFAMENDLIRADMIESTEFPQLVSKYDVMAVPKVVINDTITFEGAVSESSFIDYIMLALEEHEHT
ncbi:MAG: thioredoxin family protein [Nitrososphaerota archaeon]|nr:thioredoxin family protein [Nitrososphaerales archaeon]MDW8044936.1 thioredoxin family protein [Nitrososphaerota archaeon]